MLNHLLLKLDPSWHLIIQYNKTLLNFSLTAQDYGWACPPIFNNNKHLASDYYFKKILNKFFSTL